MSRFWLSDDELRVRFRQAKDQREQVRILADLCVVSRGEMAQYLTALGCEVPKVRPQKPRRRVPPDIVRQIWERAQNGETHKQIAADVCLNVDTVHRIVREEKEKRLP